MPNQALQKRRFFIRRFSIYQFVLSRSYNFVLKVGINIGPLLSWYSGLHTDINKYFFTVKMWFFITSKAFQVGWDYLECFWGYLFIFWNFPISFPWFFYVFRSRVRYIFVDQLQFCWINGTYCWKWSWYFYCLKLKSWF